MIWLTWRQFRLQSWISLAGLVVVGALLIVTGRTIADLWSASGAAACQTDCAAVVNNFVTSAKGGMPGALYATTLVALYALPALLGAFWGAPLIAREYETGTHRLVWNQSVTRVRWLATKVCLLGAAAMATTGLLSLGVSLWARRVDDSGQITRLLFGARGITPVAYTAFAFALGATIGMLIRRTVPAMAVTLALYVGVVATMTIWVRAHLLPARHQITPLNLENLREFMMSENGRRVSVLSDPDIHGGWLLSNDTITTSGQVFQGPANMQYCGRDIAPGSCLHWIDSLHLRSSIAYLPNSSFWPLQLIESGIFLALAAALIAFCFRRIRTFS
jgi:hypothetical protein